MKLGDTVQLALRNLRQAKLRTALTTLGVSIGIASLAGMVSLGVGLEDQLLGRFMQSGLFDSITVLPAQGRGGFGRGGAFERGRRGPGGGFGRAARSAGTAPVPATPATPLDDAAIRSIAGLEHVASVYPNVRVPVELRFEATSERGLAAGVPMSARNETAFQSLSFGSFFKDETTKACLISLDMAHRLSEHDPATLIGQPLTLTYVTLSTASTPPPATGGLFDSTGNTRQTISESYTIVGIVEREPGAALAGNVSGVMLPLAQAVALDAASARAPIMPFGLGAPGAEASDARIFSSLTVKVLKPEFTEDVEDHVKSLGFTAFSVTDALTGAKRAFLILDIVLALIGSIALAVSSLGIVNTMVMSILERTREIGIMKAIGGSDIDIRRIFLVEASTIGVLGGVAGVALGWLVGRVINFGANVYIQSQGGTPSNLFALPVWLVAGAIGFSWIVSLIAGSYPAARAARLDPIQALRHD